MPNKNFPSKERIMKEPAGEQVNDWIAEFIMGWELVDRKSKANNLWLDKKSPSTAFPRVDWIPSSGIYNAMEMEDYIYSETSSAVRYINALKRIAGQPDRGQVVDDWHHWYCVAHATPLERCRAALIAYLEAS